jgi:hypothetical protein
MNFKFDKYDFFKIYESLKRYYPIGISNEAGEMYFSYSGFKELGNIIVENIHDEKNFYDRWKIFHQEIENEIGKEVKGTTYGQMPSFSSFILLETNTVENLTRTKELHFFVSLIGPFYTIIGRDYNIVNMGKLGYSKSTNHLVVSPEIEYAESFHYLCSKIESRFNGFRFIPFYIYEQTIEGLNTRFFNGNNSSIFCALFHDLIDLKTPRIIGNHSFKSEDWIKEGYIDTGDNWVIYPPFR